MNADRSDTNSKLEYFSLNQTSHRLPQYVEKPNRIITCLPFLLMTLTLTIMIIVGINVKQDLVSANKSLQAELAELKKSFTEYKNNQSQQKLEALISSNQILQEELKELKQDLEIQRNNISQQQLEALILSNQKLQDEHNKLKKNVQSDSERINDLISAQNQQQAKLVELQISTNEVARVAYKESGSIHKQSGGTAQGGGVKCSRNPVKFERAFSSIPTVVPSLASIDNRDTKVFTMRIHINAENITTNGFDLVGCTGENSMMFSYTASWIAFEK